MSDGTISTNLFKNRPLCVLQLSGVLSTLLEIGERGTNSRGSAGKKRFPKNFVLFSFFFVLYPGDAVMLTLSDHRRWFGGVLHCKTEENWKKQLTVVATLRWFSSGHYSLIDRSYFIFISGKKRCKFSLIYSVSSLQSINLKLRSKFCNVQNISSSISNSITQIDDALIFPA